MVFGATCAWTSFKIAWLIKHEFWHGFNFVLYKIILGLKGTGVP